MTGPFQDYRIDEANKARLRTVTKKHVPLEAARALVAAASPGPWLVGYEGRGDEVWSKPSDWIDADLILTPKRQYGKQRANAQLTTVAVNTWLELVEALTAANCYKGALSCIQATRKQMCIRCAALDHVAREVGA